MENEDQLVESDVFGVDIALAYALGVLRIS